MESKNPRIVGWREATNDELDRGGHDRIKQVLASQPWLTLEFDDGSREEVRVGKSVIHQLFQVLRRRTQPNYEPTVRPRVKFQALPVTAAEVAGALSRFERPEVV